MKLRSFRRGLPSALTLALLFVAALALLPATARAQAFQQTITQTSNSLHRWFGSALAADSTTLVVGDPEYRKETGSCPGGYGAIAVYKKVNGTWTFSQRFVHTAGAQETKIGASVALSGNIMVAGAQREDFSGSVFRTGAIFVYKRSSSSATFQQTAKLFPPVINGTDFTQISGIATNGTYAAGVESGGKVHVYRINSDGTAAFAVTITAPHGGMNSIALTTGNVLVLASNGDAQPWAYQLTQSGGTTTATQITTTSLATNGFVVTGGMASDGNTVILSRRFAQANPAYRAVQIVKFGSNSIQSFEDRYLPHSYDGLYSYGASGSGTPQLVVKENQGFFIGFWDINYPLVMGFKYANNTYNYAGNVGLLGPYGIAGTPYFGGALAFNGTELFVGDKDLFVSASGTNGCTQPGAQGAVHVYTPRSTLPTGPGSSRELTSWLYSQDQDHGAVAATNGSFVAAGSAFGYQAPNTFGEITLYQNVSNTWQQIEKYVDPNSGYNGFGSSVDLSAEFLAIGAGSAVNPNNGLATGMVYLKQNPGSGFEHGPWYSNLSPPSDVGAFANFGDSVALNGNILVVGAPGINRAYVYEWNGSYWSGPKVLQSSVNQTYEEFGKSVSASGVYVMVGAPYRQISGRDETGAVQFFRKNSSGNYVAAGEHTVPTGVVGNAAMGRTVALTTYYAVAGAPEGHAVTFRRASGTTTWVQDSTLLTATSEFGFGDAVAILGNDLLIGAQYSQRVHRYARSGNAFVQNGLLVGSASGFFGSALDLWNDGTVRAVIGDFEAPVSNISPGAAFFLNLSQVQ